MYSIAGVLLDDDSRGWAVDARTKTLAELSAALTAVQATGRDGVIPVGPGDMQAPVWVLYVRTSVDTREALIMLVRDGAEIELLGLTVGYSFAGVSVAEEVLAVDHCVVAFSLRLDGVWWRGPVVTSPVVALSSAAVDVSVLWGLSAPVQDAIIRVKGACTGLTVTARNSWFTYEGTLTGTQYLRFHAATGRAYITANDIWSGGTEVSGLIDYGGDRGVFELTPEWSGTPEYRFARLTVSTLTRSGASVQVRARPAYAP